MAADRSINMALRVLGIGEVERDFRKVGQAGEASFEKIEKGANGADRAVSAYTERLRRTVTVAKQAFDNTPGVAEARAADPAGYLDARNRAIVDRVELEKRRIQQGLPDLTQDFLALDGAVGTSAGSLAKWTAVGVAVGAGLVLIKEAVLASAQAFMEHEQALSAFHAELGLAGNRSNAAGAQIEAMAEKIVRSTTQTEEAALQGAASLAQVSGLTVTAFEEALAASAAYASSAGRELPDVLEGTTIPILRALAERDMKALIEATEDLDRATGNQIIRMAEAGKTAEAQAVLFAHLRDAAGDGPDGLTTATDKLGKAWDRIKISFAEEFAGPAAAGLGLLADGVDWFTQRVNVGAAVWDAFRRMVPVVGGLLPNWSVINPQSEETARPGAIASRLNAARAALANAQAEAERKAFEKRYASSPSGGGGGSTRPSGQSEADREAERLQREAEQARTAADRVIESNDEVVESYLRRAREAEEKVGLEGDALAAVERRIAVETVLRRLNREEIAREVEAQRAAAAAAGESFDEAAATDAATRAIEGKTEALRRAANAEIDAAEASELFNRRQAEARVLLEGLKTPLDRLNDQVETAIELLRAGAISAEDFDRRMDQLAEGFADVAHAADETAQAWRGFGYEVGSTLSDIALNGGSARDILKELLRLPLERFLEQGVTNPVASLIDRMTGNDRQANNAKARGDLADAEQVMGAHVRLIDPAAQGAALSLNNVGASGQAAALGLQATAVAAGQPIETLALQSEEAAEALGGLVPLTSQFGGALANVLMQLGGGGGGGSGWLGAALKIGGALLGGAAPNAALASSVNYAIEENPALFASGTPGVPVGRDFYVGENGRERMRYHGGGRLEVISGPQSHRAAEGLGSIIVQVNGARGNAEIMQMVQLGVEKGLSDYDAGLIGRVEYNKDRFG